MSIAEIGELRFCFHRAVKHHAFPFALAGLFLLLQQCRQLLLN